MAIFWKIPFKGQNFSLINRPVETGQELPASHINGNLSIANQPPTTIGNGSTIATAQRQQMRTTDGSGRGTPVGGALPGFDDRTSRGTPCAKRQAIMMGDPAYGLSKKEIGEQMEVASCKSS